MARTAGLPAPVAELWEWQLQGACRQVDSAQFFHPDSERGLARRHRVRDAKLICARCPVVQRCRDHALTTPEPYGVWGGLSEDERDAMRRGSIPRGGREPGRRLVELEEPVPLAG